MDFNDLFSDTTRFWFRRIQARKRAVANIVELAHLVAHLVRSTTSKSLFEIEMLELELDTDGIFSEEKTKK